MDFQQPSGERLWYYARNGQTCGPERESDLCQQFLSGKLSMSTLIWADGMSEWRPADEMEVFSQAIPEVEAEEVPSGEEESTFDESSYQGAPQETLWPSRPEPFRRYLARKLDMLIATYLYFQITGVIFDGSMASLSTYLLWVIPPWAIIEGLCLHYWGFTPGKWILRIEVTDQWGRRLGLQQSMRRGIDVAVRGMGLGIPVLHMFTQIHALLRLGSTGVTVWDETSRVVVRHPPLEIWRWLALLVLVLTRATHWWPMF